MNGTKYRVQGTKCGARMGFRKPNFVCYATEASPGKMFSGTSTASSASADASVLMSPSGGAAADTACDSTAMFVELDGDVGVFVPIAWWEVKMQHKNRALAKNVISTAAVLGFMPRVTGAVFTPDGVIINEHKHPLAVDTGLVVTNEYLNYAEDGLATCII